MKKGVSIFLKVYYTSDADSEWKSFPVRFTEKDESLWGE